MPASDDETRVLPKSQRILFSLIVPILAILGSRIFIWYLWDPLPPHATLIDLFLSWYVKGALLLIFTPFLVWAAVRSAFRPWRYWWSALLGGAVATVVAFALGGFVILLAFAFKA